MKGSHLKWHLAVVFILVMTAVSFQNCSQGFKSGIVQPASLEPSASNSGGTTQNPANPAAPENVDLTPLTIIPPAGLNIVGMNINTKILISVPQAAGGMSYVVRSQPKSGTLTLSDLPGPNGGVIYTPVANYLGLDSFVLAVRNSAGQMGPDQKIDLRVDQKGIGQMVGTFQNPVCVPNTGPNTATYISTDTQFTFNQRGYTVDCATAIFDLEIKGQHSVGAENVPTLAGVTGFEYNITNKVMTVKPISAIAAQTLNAQNYCGFNNWVANVVKDLSVTGCSGYWGGPNTFMFRRVEIVNGQTRLFISSLQGGIGTTPANRTQGLATGYYLVKIAN